MSKNTTFTRENMSSLNPFINTLKLTNKTLLHLHFNDESVRTVPLHKFKFTNNNVYIDDVFVNNVERIDVEIINNEENVRVRNVRCGREGGFCKYRLLEKYNSLAPILERYQVFTSLDGNQEHKKKVNMPCLIYAIKQVDTSLDETKITEMYRFLGSNVKMGDIISTNVLKEFGQAFNYKFVVKEIQWCKDNREICTLEHKSRGSTRGSKNDNAITINLGILDNHYFVYDKDVPVCEFYLEHIDEIGNDSKKHRTYRRTEKGYYKTDSTKKMNSIRFIEKCISKGIMQPLSYQETDVQNTVMHKYFNSSTPHAIDFDSKYFAKAITNETTIPKKKIDVEKVYFADTETCKKKDCKNVITEEVFMLCITNYSGTWKHTYVGFDCVEQCLNDLDDGSVMYFHNAGFDGRFFMKYCVGNVIQKGQKIMSMKLRYNNNSITIRDSYSVIPFKLAKFPECFNEDFVGTNVQKEVFPYDFYTYDRVSKCLNNSTRGQNRNVETNECQNLDMSKRFPQEFPIGDALIYKTDLLKKIFIKNVQKLQHSDIEPTMFNPMLYCEFYCRQDVEVLRIGFNAFRKMCMREPINEDIVNHLTIPSLANKLLTKNVFIPNKKIFMYRGNVQHYLQQFVRGGRCMSAENKVVALKDTTLFDFDARSLYPSAMARMFTVEGVVEPLKDVDGDVVYNSRHLPNILIHAFDESQIEGAEDKYISQFFITIDIVEIGKCRKFPIISKRTENGVMYVNECCRMYVDMITLQDLITFQDISFKIVEGYIMKGNRDYRIQTFIKGLFDKRNEFKNNGNPTQLAIKLLMNSMYGKAIQKPIAVKRKVINTEDFHYFFCKNCHFFIESQPIGDGSKTIVQFEKDIEKQFNNVVFGITVLSMSKRIMNEVMCLAEDLGVNIYYQDTDSMFIEASGMSTLSETFKNKYGRELIGDKMGQFHNDIEEVKDGYIKDLMVVGKKVYHSVVANDNGETGEHYRMKGIPQDVVEKCAVDKYNGCIQVIYEDLLSGNTIDFDLLNNDRCCFRMTNDRIEHVMKFSRKIKKTCSE